MEAEKLGAKIGEVSVETRNIEKKRSVAWKHFYQFWYVVKAIIGILL